MCSSSALFPRPWPPQLLFDDFFASIFQLVDTWTESCNAEDYIEMVLRLVDGICFRDNGGLKFKDDEQVGAAERQEKQRVSSLAHWPPFSARRFAPILSLARYFNHPHLAPPMAASGMICWAISKRFDSTSPAPVAWAVQHLQHFNSLHATLTLGFRRRLPSTGSLVSSATSRPSSPSPRPLTR